MPDRHGPLRTPIGWFTERVNGGAISEGAVVAYGDDLGLEEVELPFLEGFGPVPGEQVSILAPAGIRGDGEVDPGDLLVLVPGSGSRSDEISVNEGSFYEGPVSSFFPYRTWLHQDTPFEPSERWWPKRYDSSSMYEGEGKVLLAVGDQEPAEVFSAADTGNNPFDTGNNPFNTGNNPFDTGNNPFLVGISGNRFVAITLGQPFVPAELFDAGQPAPLGGATFGMGVLSTPNASVAGESANPLVGVETKALLQREETRRMLRRAGVTDADEVEWISGPTAVSDIQGEIEITLLEEKTQLESFQGVVSGENGPWWVAVHVARVTVDDYVVAAGVQRAPLGTAKTAAKKGDTTLGPAREYMAQAVDRLVVK
ncbi:DUF6517 family protein [Haloplanus aerogenes]|uniref:Uncharacterized protein n=1 Tax=Haloplanus aerogenes TaxID=660522 RepID=A0A3M0CWZ2_9EURY|nr:DUF6517 family protein [Haloplanus aerogenes]AZH24787.1 hypothetical protein DU502_05080 [Haloplanus aerogenes]RMB08323.1 hypothetical protein ATH50_3538 [Haloplanus aerogenes]